jgi:16S rRNA (cytidine1402-2'-O)-methyltransferase
VAGRLSVVPTPIGNLADVTLRALETLRSADVIACEDTRRTRALLSAHAIPAPRLVAAAVEAGVSVELVPGPSAVVAALVLSGLPTARFCFEGFLPRKGRERAERLADVAGEPRTTVLYEAPHRLHQTVADLAAACGPDRRIAIARELTKRFEDVWRGTLAEAVDRSATMEARGEHVLVVEGAPDAPEATAADVDAAVRRRLDAGLSTRDAAAEVADALGVPKRTAYNAAVRLSR